MAEVMSVNLLGVGNKWQKLLLTLSNMPEPVIRCCFADGKTARTEGNRMNTIIREHPSWFNVLVVVRSSDVYIVKIGKPKKVVVRV